MPLDNAFFSTLMLQSVIITKMGSSGIIALSFRARSIPSMSGNEKSRTAKFGDCRFTVANASTPFSPPRKHRIRCPFRKWCAVDFEAPYHHPQKGP